MFNVLSALIAISLSLILGGCSSTVKQETHLKALTKPISLYDTKNVRARLKQHYQLWQGTPYQYGGQTLKGVDCSAYVQNAYQHALGYSLPRTTRTQIKKGKKIAKSELKVGDVVFFKISRNGFHNGVYIGNSEFIHASSSKGVTISNLNNPYWKRTYLTARRMH